jgi:hypothetical protein
VIRRGSASRWVAAATLLVLVSCGKKGPPLAPLHLVPAAIEEISAVRRGADVELRFKLPGANANGPGPVDLDRVEVYAVTVAPSTPPPANRELLSKPYLVGTVPVKPVPEDGGPPVDPNAPATADDKRPSPGERAVFVETLTEDKLKPVAPKTRPVPKAQPKAPEPLPFLQRKGPQHATRVYGLRGATRGGRPGAASAQVAVELSEPPPPAAGVKVAYTEEALTVTWDVPPLPETPVSDELAQWVFLAPQFPYLFHRAPPPATTYNVYLAGQPTPLNTAPLPQPEFARAGVEFGSRQCFVVRTVRTTGAVATESAPSEPACVTPADTFPPAAPKGLQAVSGAGDINLSWDANTETDLGGYIVLRGEAPGTMLQALTPAPIAETRYRDAAVTQGVRYVYAVVAVDKAKPPNTSAQSARVDETAR